MENILIKATKIIEEGKNNYDFFGKYADSLIGTGERSCDYSVYAIELNEDYTLIIDFVDFSYKDFSIINHKQKDSIRNVISD